MSDCISNDFRYCSPSELPAIMKPSDLQSFFGISRSAAYRLLHMPGFPVIRVGSAMRIPREKLVLWIESQADEKTPDQNPKIVGI